MSIKGTAINVAAALVAASASVLAFAQAPAGTPPRRPSPEVEALNPPVPADLVLAEDRRVPAE